MRAVSVVFNLLIVEGVLANYPDSQKRKACARQKNVVIVQGPLCTPQSGGGFTSDSEDNCKVMMKKQCPEFNKAECTKYDMVFPEDSSPYYSVPACKLSYYARAYSWMEIYFANYKYTSSTVPNKDPFDIVEIHRKIKRHESFGNRDQEDWPKSVLDPRGERGLHWVDVPVSTLEPFNDTITAPGKSPFCAQPGGGDDVAPPNTEERCEKYFVNYLQTYYPIGINPNETYNNITWSPFEIEAGSVKSRHDAKCMYIVVNKIRCPACQVIFKRHSEANGCESNYEYLEVQLYKNPLKSSEFLLRYGYWNYEKPETRDQLFKNCP